MWGFLLCWYINSWLARQGGTFCRCQEKQNPSMSLLQNFTLHVVCYIFYLNFKVKLRSLIQKCIILHILNKNRKP